MPSDLGPLTLHLKKIEAQSSLILLVARDANNKRYTVQVTDFKPYFFVKDTKENRTTLKKRGLPSDVAGRPTIYGTPTLRVEVDSPGAVPKRRQGFDRSHLFEADVPYTRRFLVDTGIHDGFEVRDYMLLGDVIIASWHNLVPVMGFRTPDRQFQYDIETNKPVGSKHYSPPTVADGAVTALSFHDSFDEAHVQTHFWHPERGTTGAVKVDKRHQWSDAFEREIPWTIYTYGSEEEFIVGMLQKLKRDRPDVMQAWNGHQGLHKKNLGGFDAPYLINRLRRIGLSPGQLSPFGGAFAGRKLFGKEASASDSGKFQCHIDGVQLLDSMCVGIKHKVLRPDLTWTAAGDLKPGDQVASFDEEGPRRMFKVGIVTHNNVQEADTFLVKLEDGTEIVTTSEHPWLVKSYDNQHRWVKTKDLMRAKNRALRVIRPTERRQGWEAGWLSGILDGEGSLKQLDGAGSKANITIAQRPGRVMDSIQTMLRECGYTFGLSDKVYEGRGDCQQVQINGGKEDALRLLQEFRPMRLLDNFRWAKLGNVVVKPENVIAVRDVVPIGRGLIANLSVDAKTYIVDGFLMHNTTFQVKEGGFTAQVPFTNLKSVAEKYTNKKMKKDPTAIEDWWLHNTEQFLLYSFNDVDALVGLERHQWNPKTKQFDPTQGYLAFAREIQQFVGAEDANKLFTPMSLITTLLLRIAKEEGVSLPTSDSDREDYEAEGGFVLNPRTKGVQRRMGVNDLAAMYVNVIISGNLSPETHVPNPSEAEMEDLICVPSDLGPQFFLKPAVKEGLFPKAVKRLKALRERYDALIQDEPDASKIKVLKQQRQPAKQLLLAVFGVSLSDFFCMFKPEVGSSITGTGRYIATESDRFVESLGDKVHYQDTDSVFTPLPEDDPVAHGQWLAEQINLFFDKLAAAMNMDTHSFEIGLEKIYDPFIQGDQKKMYAGYVVWAEGKWQDEPVFEATGIAGIKSDAAPITRDASDTVLKALLNGTPPLEVMEYIRTLHEGVLNGDVPLQEVIKAITLNFDIDDPKSTETHVVKGARYGKGMYDFEYPVGGKVRMVRVKGSDDGWLAIPDGEDLPNDMTIDMEHHAELTVLRPLQNLLDWVDMSVDSVRFGTVPTIQRRLA